MKRLVLLFLSSILCFSSFAHNDTIRPPRPKVGLVLSGGGAKGAAHIGVLKYIEEIGIPIDYIAGTSMGSIIGGLYALGYSPDELKEFISQLDWGTYMTNSVDRRHMSSSEKLRKSTYLISIPFSIKKIFSKDKPLSQNEIDGLPSILFPKSFAGGITLLNLFNSLCIGYQDEMSFNDLPIPFACVATDMITGKEVVLRHGKFPEAIRASMAIPGIFDPIKIDNYILMDGGFTNNFPANRCREMGADIIIGIEVAKGVEVKESELSSLPQLLGQVKNIAIENNNVDNRELCDIYIRPDAVNAYNMLSFSHDDIDSIVNIGYEYAQNFKSELEGLKQYLADNGSSQQIWHAPKAKTAGDHICISKITINNVNDKEFKWLIRKSGLVLDQPIPYSDLTEAIETFRGTYNFSKIAYRLKPIDMADEHSESSRYELTIDLEFSEPHSIDIGFRYDTEESATLLFNLGLNQRKMSGAKANFKVGLGYNSFFDGALTYAGLSLANFNVNYHFDMTRYNTLTRYDSNYSRLEFTQYYQNRFRFYISEFHLRRFQVSVGVESERYTFFQTPSTGWFYNPSNDSENFRNTSYSPYVKIKFDNMDHAYFATEGVQSALDLHWFKSHADSKNPSDFLATAFFIKGNISADRFTFIPQFYARCLFGKNIPFAYKNMIGGAQLSKNYEHHLPFIGFNQALALSDDNAVAIVRLDMRYRIANKHYVSLLSNYARFSCDVPNFFRSNSPNDDILGCALQYSYNSILGPISIDVHWQNYTNSLGAYINIGYEF